VLPQTVIIPPPTPKYEITVTVPAATPIDVRIVEDIHPAKVKTGDRLMMIADRDVVINGNIVISKGARIVAEAAESREKSYAGQPGRILVSFRTVTAVDDQEILIAGSSRREGQDKMLESIGLGVVCCPLFLLMKGDEGIIPAGQTVQVYTMQKADVKVKKY